MVPNLHFDITKYSENLDYSHCPRGRTIATVYIKYRKQKRTTVTHLLFQSERQGRGMKGYFTESGYMGYVNGKYVLFASEADYIEYATE